MRFELKCSLVCWVALAAACGGSKPPEAEAPALDPAAQSSRSKPLSGGPSVSQELGSIDPQDADRVFQSVQGQFQTCQKTGMKRVGPLAGDVKFFVRIGSDGKAKYVVLEDSTLGDIETESCMMHAVERARWPVPRGGNEAEARKGYGFDAGDERAPTVWGADKIEAAIAKHQKELQNCTAGVKGSFKVTLYVEAEKKDGKAIAVGVAAPNSEAQAKAACIVDVVKSMKLPSPGGYLAKSTFSL
jgi:hypothetical protein